METLRNEPVILSGNGPVGGSNDGLASGLAIGAALANKNDYHPYGFSAFGADPYGQLAADQSGETLLEIAKSECSIKDTIQRLQLDQTINFRNLDNRICDVEKEAIKSGYESRIETKESKFDVIRALDAEGDQIKKDIADFHHHVDKQFCQVDKQFCDLDRRISDKFADLERRELEAKVAALQEKLADAKAGTQTQTILGAIAGLIGQVGGPGNSSK